MADGPCPCNVPRSPTGRIVRDRELSCPAREFTIEAPAVQAALRTPSTACGCRRQSAPVPTASWTCGGSHSQADEGARTRVETAVLDEKAQYCRGGRLSDMRAEKYKKSRTRDLRDKTFL